MVDLLVVELLLVDQIALKSLDCPRMSPHAVDPEYRPFLFRNRA
jgi:hypothetical protein